MNQKKYSEKDDLIFKGKCIRDVLVVLNRVFEKTKIAFGISNTDILVWQMMSLISLVL